MAILTAENLNYIYSPDSPFKHDAIKNVSFSLEGGEILGIIGHTGSGKSTLMQLLNGLLKPTSGKIMFDGKDIWENPKEIGTIRFKIGLVFQYPEYQLFEETVEKDISFGPRNMKLTDDEISARTLSAAATVGLHRNLLQKSPFDLSGGEKRRTAIAGIMAMKPEIIIFDEPTAGLDPIGRETVLKAICDYRKSNNATVIIVSHSMEDVASICDKVLVLNDGQVFMYDTIDNVFSNYESLKNIGLTVPEITKVMLSLKASGVDIDTKVYTVDKAVEVISAYLSGGNVQ